MKSTARLRLEKETPQEPVSVTTVYVGAKKLPAIELSTRLPRVEDTIAGKSECRSVLLDSHTTRAIQDYSQQFVDLALKDPTFVDKAFSPRQKAGRIEVQLLGDLRELARDFHPDRRKLGGKEFAQALFSFADQYDHRENTVKQTDTYGSPLEEAVSHFLHGVVDRLTLRAQAHHSDDVTELSGNFGYYLREHGREFSPYIGGLPVSVLLELTTKATRVPEMRNTLGGDFVRFVLEALATRPDVPPSDIAEALSRLKIPELLDVMDQCVSLANYGRTELDNSDTITHTLASIISAVANYNTSPLVGYEVERALAELAQETAPSEKIKSFERVYYGPDGRAEVAVPGAFLKEDSFLKSATRAPGDPYDGYLSKLASDYVGRFDRNITLRALAPHTEGTRETLTASTTPTVRSANLSGLLYTGNDRLGLKCALSFLDELSPTASYQRLTKQRPLHERLGLSETDLTNAIAKDRERQTALLSCNLAERHFLQTYDETFKLFDNLFFTSLGQNAEQLRARFPDAEELALLLDRYTDQYQSSHFNNARRVGLEIIDIVGELLGIHADSSPENQRTGEQEFRELRGVGYVLGVLDYFKIDSHRGDINSDLYEINDLLDSGYLRDRDAIDSLRKLESSHRELEERQRHNADAELFELGPLSATKRDQVAARLVDFLREVAALEDTRGDVLNFSPLESLVGDSRLDPFSRLTNDELLLLRRLHHPKLRERIELDLGVDLRSMPLRSQIHFMRFLSAQDSAGFARIRDALHRNPQSASDILSSFFASADDPKIGNHILTLAEGLGPELAAEVFPRYLEIAGAADNLEQRLVADYGLEKLTPEQIAAIRRNQLRRANRILERWGDELSAPGDLGARLRSIRGELQSLDDANHAVTVSASIYPEIARQVGIDQLANSNLYVGTGANLSPALRKEATRISLRNCHEKYAGDPTQPNLWWQVHKSFVDSLDDSNSTICMLTIGGKVVSFTRLTAEPENPEKLYWGSANTHIDAQGGKIGFAFLGQILSQLTADKTVVATAYVPSGLLDSYHQHFGFKDIGEDGTNPNIHHIARPPFEQR